jgi:succinate dehydrogenase / fumarate reductase membrane anchor subunit
MGVYTFMMLAVLASTPKLDYWSWKTLWAMPVMRYATVLFLLSLYLHAWIGVRNIFMDYIKDPGLRLMLYVLVIGALIGYGLWSVQILWVSDGASGKDLDAVIVGGGGSGAARGARAAHADLKVAVL